MSWCSRRFGLWTLIGAGLLVGGCAQDRANCVCTPSRADILPVGSGAQDKANLPQSRDTPLVPTLPDMQAGSHTVRSQQPETPPQPPAGPTPTHSSLGAPQAAPVAPPPTGVGKTSIAAPPPTADSIEPSLAVRVRAWVNSKAIFDDEVRERLPRRDLIEVSHLPAAQRDVEVQKIYKMTLDGLIDVELLKQEALRKLEQNPKYLDKIKTQSAKESEKKIREFIRDNKIPSREEFKRGLEGRGTSEESLRGLIERDYIASEYMKVVIFPIINKEVTPEVIARYYQQHQSEFQTQDRVQWQDIFIKVGDKRPTLAHVRQFAEQLVQQWKQDADVSKLLEFDDGLSRYRKGMGAGEIKGEIQPRELEENLFHMKDGEIGPLVELATGIHIFRLIKRETAGVMPFNDEKTQQMIGNKLKAEMFDRERKRLIHDLRDKASIVYVDANAKN